MGETGVHNAGGLGREVFRYVGRSGGPIDLSLFSLDLQKMDPEVEVTKREEDRRAREYTSDMFARIAARARWERMPLWKKTLRFVVGAVIVLFVLGVMALSQG